MDNQSVVNLADKTEHQMAKVAPLTAEDGSEFNYVQIEPQNVSNPSNMSLYKNNSHKALKNRDTKLLVQLNFLIAWQVHYNSIIEPDESELEDDMEGSGGNWPTEVESGYEGSLPEGSQSQYWEYQYNPNSSIRRR